MLATYPEVFAGGAIIAGLPFGIAGNVREALNGMMQSSSRPARELGDLVRRPRSTSGPWPKLSVWQAAPTARCIPPTPTNRQAMARRARIAVGADVESHRRRLSRHVWWNADGETTVESYTITAWPTVPRRGSTPYDSYGAAGAFMIEAGISSSYHIANSSA